MNGLVTVGGVAGGSWGGGPDCGGLGDAFGLGDGVGWGLGVPEDGLGDGRCVVPGVGVVVGWGLGLELGLGLGLGDAVAVGLGVGVLTGGSRPCRSFRTPRGSARAWLCPVCVP
ncbi:hypothetical protein [Streptomyces sp. NPDC051921]|uniref:hypothetical protein n=1 Tax=Streptomyces sp. NPDC051921 TaxID=3155806 RepID=UPI00343651A8